LFWTETGQKLGAWRPSNKAPPRSSFITAISTCHQNDEGTSFDLEFIIANNDKGIEVL
jgi:hypothetical protein